MVKLIYLHLFVVAYPSVHGTYVIFKQLLRRGFVCPAASESATELSDDKKLTAASHFQGGERTITVRSGKLGSRSCCHNAIVVAFYFLGPGPGPDMYSGVKLRRGSPVANKINHPTLSSSFDADARIEFA